MATSSERIGAEVLQHNFDDVNNTATDHYVTTFSVKAYYFY
jgi:hypothetical protein